MIDDNNDLSWLKAQKPSVEPPDAEATKWARAAVLAHAQKTRQVPHLVAQTPAGSKPVARRGLAGFLRGRRALAAAAAVTIVAAAGITAIVGIPHTGNNGLVNGVPTAQAKTLLALSSRVLAASPPPGDATLVQHSNKLSDGTFTGADLYLDNGDYYYAPTVAGLRGASAITDFDLKPALAAAAGVATADAQSARAAFLQTISSSLYPKIGLLSGTRAQQDNYIWITAIDALGAADGRPAVLAGMLNVLATVDGLTVTRDTYQGQSVLELTLTTHVVPPVPWLCALTRQRRRTPACARNSKRRQSSKQLIRRRRTPTSRPSRSTTRPAPCSSTRTSRTCREPQRGRASPSPTTSPASLRPTTGFDEPRAPAHRPSTRTPR